MKLRWSTAPAFLGCLTSLTSLIELSQARRQTTVVGRAARVAAIHPSNENDNNNTADNPRVNPRHVHSRRPDDAPQPAPLRNVTLVCDTSTVRADALSTGGDPSFEYVSPAHCWVIFEATSHDAPLRVEIVAPVLDFHTQGLAIAVTEYAGLYGDRGQLDYPQRPPDTTRRNHVFVEATRISNHEIFDPIAPPHLPESDPNAPRYRPRSLVELVWISNARLNAHTMMRFSHDAYWGRNSPLVEGSWGDSHQFARALITTPWPGYDLDPRAPVSSFDDDVVASDDESYISSDGSSLHEADVPSTAHLPHDPSPGRVVTAWEQILYPGLQWASIARQHARGQGNGLSYKNVRELFYDSPPVRPGAQRLGVFGPAAAAPGARPRRLRILSELISTNIFFFDLIPRFVSRAWLALPPDLATTPRAGPGVVALSRDPKLTSDVWPVGGRGSLREQQHGMKKMPGGFFSS